MTTTPIPPDNSLPIVLGYKYRLKGEGDNWVEIVGLTNTKVTVTGLGNTIAVWTVPKWQFDELVHPEYIAV